MDIRNYWQQGVEAYREVKHQQVMEQLEVEHAALETKLAKVRAVPCNCDLLDAHQCYADKHDTTEIDDSRWCRCRCHRIAEQENLLD